MASKVKRRPKRRSKSRGRARSAPRSEAGSPVEAPVLRLVEGGVHAGPLLLAVSSAEADVEPAQLRGDAGLLEAFLLEDGELEFNGPGVDGVRSAEELEQIGLVAPEVESNVGSDGGSELGTSRAPSEDLMSEERSKSSESVEPTETTGGGVASDSSSAGEVPDVVDLAGDSNESESGASSSNSSEEEAWEPDSGRRSGVQEQKSKPVVRSRRNAAAVARALMETASQKVSRSRSRSEASSGDVEGSEVSEVEEDFQEIESLVERRVTANGVKQYLVKWRSVKRGEDEYEWVDADDITDNGPWKKLIDEWYVERKRVFDDNKKNLTLREFLKHSIRAIKMGESDDFGCVYSAVRKLMELQGGEMMLTDALIQEFETGEGVSRVAERGLGSGKVDHLFSFLLRRGWKVRLSQNLYQGSLSGYRGIALVIDGQPGLYFVGTMGEDRAGHCVVVEVSKSNLASVYDGGVRMALADFAGAEQILWIQRCEQAQLRGVVVPLGVIEAGGVVKPTEVAVARKKRVRIRKRNRG